MSAQREAAMAREARRPAPSLAAPHLISTSETVVSHWSSAPHAPVCGVVVSSFFGALAASSFAFLAAASAASFFLAACGSTSFQPAVGFWYLTATAGVTSAPPAVYLTVGGSVGVQSFPLASAEGVSPVSVLVTTEASEAFLPSHVLSFYP